MELVALLRVLWRHRIVVVIGGVVALGLGAMLVRGPTSRLGVASTRVVLDTPTSQLLFADPPGAPTLGWRTQLLGDVMTTAAMRQRIAQAMGTTADDVIITTPAQSVAVVPVSLPVVALDAAASVAATKPFQVDLTAATPLPIIRIDTRAPDARSAVRLARTTSTSLKRAARAGAASPGFPDLLPQDLVVRDVGAVRSREIVNGPRRAKAAAAVIFVFALWCGAVTLCAGLARARRPPPPALPSATA